MWTLTELSRDLASGKTCSEALVEQALARIHDQAGQGSLAFLSVYEERARDEARRIDHARHRNWSLPPYAGIPLSIKDLFDVAGEVTRAGSHVLDEHPAASSDADIVQLLRAAGFVLVGKTNMTEFAYSGLGINGHYGTPLSPYARDVGHIPGGSSSGGAVSVADGMAVATIGTDTGGSCRIPAAYCGIVGFKPTSTRVSRRGAVPLSLSMDSIGPLANSVSCCAALDAILAGLDTRELTESSFLPAGLRFGVLRGYLVDQLHPHVAACFEAALSRLSDHGVQLTELTIPELDDLPRINRLGGIVGAEAYAWHRVLLETRGDFYDPWVKARFAGGQSQSAADYLDTLAHRERIIRTVEERSVAFDALVMPTVQIPPPVLADMQDGEQSVRDNLLSLKNTAVGNFLDRPSVSIPCHLPGEAPVGFMLMGETMADRRLLSIARGVEFAVRAA